MRRLALALVALVLLRADMYPDASNAKLPEARINLGAMPSLDARDHGVTCDGTTDDRTTLQAAVTAAAAKGNAVHISPGPAANTTCLLSGFVTVPANITIWAVPGTVTLKPTATNATTVLLLNIANVSNVTIYGLVLDGGGADFATANNVNQVYNSENVVFDTVRVQNTRGIGVLFSTTTRNSGIRNSVFINNGNHWKTTMVPTHRVQAVSFCCGLAEGNYGNFVTGSYFTDTGLDPVSAGNQRDFLMANNRCNHQQFQWLLGLGTSTGAACFYSTASNGITVTGNVVNGAPGNGIDIFNTKNAVVTGNSSTHNGDCGIGMFGTTSGTVSGNISLNNGHRPSPLSANGGSGICIGNAGTGGSSYVIVTGNATGDNQDVVSTACVGTVAVGAKTCTATNLTGVSYGGRISIAGAGAAGAALVTEVTSVTGTVTLNWFDATATATTDAAVTGVATQQYGIYSHPSSVFAELKISQDNIVSNNLTGALGGVAVWSPGFAADGSAGKTCSVPAAGATITLKNGLVTALTGCP